MENSLKSIHDLCFMFALVIRYCVAGFAFIFCSDWFPRTGISPRPLMTLKPTVLVKESSRLLNSSGVQRHWASRASRASLAEDSTPILPRCCKTLQSAAMIPWNPSRTPHQAKRSHAETSQTPRQTFFQTFVPRCDSPSPRPVDDMIESNRCSRPVEDA